MIFNAPHLMAAFGITITETDLLYWIGAMMFFGLGSLPSGLRNLAVARRFPPPWSIDELEACFVVIDSAGQSWRMSISRMSLASDRRSPELASGLPTFCLYLK